MIRLITILKEVLEESRIDFLKQQFVDNGQIVNQEEFNNIITKDPTSKKIYFQWLLTNFNKEFKKKGKDYNDFLDQTQNISKELEFFDQNKQLFQDKDINHYSIIDLNNTIKRINKNLNMDQESNNETLLSPIEIDKLKKVNINYLGKIGEYQVFKIPKGNNKDETRKTYANIICKGTTHLCTASNMKHFEYYTTNGDLFIIVGNDKESPYQVSFFNNSYANRDNKDIENIEVWKVIRTLEDKFSINEVKIRRYIK